MDTTEHDIEILDSAIEQRHKEAALYQININNFEHIVREIEGIPAPPPDAPDYDQREFEALSQFADQLRGRIANERIELRKTGLIVRALVAQREKYGNAET